MGGNYRPKHVELIVIINEIVIVASSWLFIILCYFCEVSFLVGPNIMPELLLFLR